MAQMGLWERPGSVHVAGYIAINESEQNSLQQTFLLASYACCACAFFKLFHRHKIRTGPITHSRNAVFG